MKKQLKTDISLADIDRGWKIVRGMVEAAEDRIILTARDRIVALKQIKILVGLLVRPPLLKGGKKGRRDLATDLAVIADEDRFGSLPGAVRAHMRNGTLSNTTAERSHIDRIRAIKREIKRRRYSCS